MTSAELLHRLREAATSARWRRLPPGLDRAVGDGPVRRNARLAERLAEAAALPSVQAAAARIRAGRHRFLGRDWPAVDWAVGGGEAFWLHDPVTGRPWPGAATPSLAIDFRSTGADPAGGRFGDAKFVWEPGRLQMLHPLAAMAAAGDREAARTALAILRDFARTNPPYRGVHWASGIELALRLVGLTLLASALEGLDADDRILVRRLAVAHARQLAAFPSLHSSANNHRAAEGLGLYLAGRLLPDLGAVWEAEGRAILEAIAPRLILEDGGGAEQSLVYGAFTLEMIAFAAWLAAEDGRPLAGHVAERLARGARFLGAMLDEAGHAPAIGDDDETRVIALPSDREPRYVASVVAAVAGLTRSPDLAPPARDAHLRDRIFAAPTEARAAPDGVLTFREAGYTAVRTRIGARRAHLVLDHGPLGYLGLAAHGHGDALAIWLSLEGRPVLVDAGTYLYHSGGAARLLLRESGSHNTLLVGGASQSRAASAFGWSRPARAGLLAATEGPDWSVTAGHDGYRRRFDVEHRRRLSRDGAGLAIGDRLHGARRALPVEVRFLLPGALDLAADARGVTVHDGDATLCRLTAPEGFGVRIERGPAEGAIRSPRFGEIEAAQRIVFAGRLGAAEAVTRIGPAEPDAREDAVARFSLATTACGA